MCYWEPSRSGNTAHNTTDYNLATRMVLQISSAQANQHCHCPTDDQYKQTTGPFEW